MKSFLESLGAALFMWLVGVLIIGLPCYMVSYFYHWEPRTLLRSPQLNAQNYQQFEQGDLVKLEGIISDNNTLLHKEIVVGIARHFESQEDGWDTLTDDPVTLQLESLPVRLVIDNPEPRGLFVKYEVGSVSRRIQWVGYVVGSPIGAIAEVSKTRPFELEVLQHFGGNLKSYADKRLASKKLWDVASLILLGLWSLLCLMAVIGALNEEQTDLQMDLK